MCLVSARLLFALLFAIAMECMNRAKRKKSTVRLAQRKKKEEGEAKRWAYVISKPGNRNETSEPKGDSAHRAESV